MNCGNFETIMYDLARERTIDAATRDRALAHTENCVRCAARLADERALAAGLKALAATDEAESAPAVVETVLLAAFRRQVDSSPIVVDAAASTRSRQTTWRWAWAATAAVILLASGFLVYRAIQSDPGRNDGAVVKDKENMQQSPAPQPSVTPPVIENEPQPKITPVDKLRRRLAATHRSGKRPPPPPFLIRESITSYANEFEETTDFVSVNYEGAQTPMESGQLIRVRMPRSALARFGLPVNLEQADVPVKADVLVGDDGLARAIRFVR